MSTLYMITPNLSRSPCHMFFQKRNHTVRWRWLLWT